MRTTSLLLSLFIVSYLTACNTVSSQPSKGQEVNRCMERGTPADCDQRVNRRSNRY